MIRDWINRIEIIVSSLSFTLLICVTLVGVWYRRVLNSPIPWLEEVQLLLIVWTCFIGASLALRGKQHMAMDFFYDLFGDKSKRRLDIAAEIVIAVIMIFFTYQSAKLIHHYTLSSRTSSMLSIPAVVTYGIIPACSLNMAISSTANLIDLLKSGDRRKS